MFVLFYITTYVSLNFTQLGGLHMYAMLFATSFKVVVIVFILSKYLWSKSGILELCELGEVETWIQPFMSIILIIVVFWNMIISFCVLLIFHCDENMCSSPRCELLFNLLLLSESWKVPYIGCCLMCHELLIM